MRYNWNSPSKPITVGERYAISWADARSFRRISCADESEGHFLRERQPRRSGMNHPSDQPVADPFGWPIDTHGVFPFNKGGLSTLQSVVILPPAKPEA